MAFRVDLLLLFTPPPLFSLLFILFFSFGPFPYISRQLDTYSLEAGMPDCLLVMH